LSAPVLDPRKQADVLAALTRDLPGYTPEWTPGPASPGLALMKIFARFAGILIGGVNRVPDRNQLAFLDAMGIHLLPAQAAEAPLVFTLAQTSPVDVTLPANSQVAAPPQPALPSVATADPPQIASSQPVPFATMESISLSRAKLATLYSIDPGSDEYADHSASLTTGFTLFENMGLTEHAIYLGHDTLFAFNGSIKLLLLIGLRAGADTALSIQWEYLASTGWVALSSAPEDDTTGGLQQDGTIIVQRDCGPAAKLDTFAGQKSYWVRGRLTAPLLPDNQLGGKRTVPVINSFLVRISTTQSGLAPEASFADSVALDVSKDFYPFGQQPARSSTFYLASTEVFQRSAANVQISIKLSQDGVTQGNFTLVWEYFNGSEWSGLGIQSDSTDPSGYLFTKDANLSFLCPRDWQPTKVNGVKNYWLRAWIKSGSYGSPVRVNLPPATDITAVSSDGLTLTVNSIDGYNGGEQVTIVDSHSATPMGNSIQQAQSPNKLVVTSSIAVTYSGGQVLPPAGLPLLASPSLQPPIITSLKLSYTFLTDPELLNHCLSKNDFVFEDDTEASLWPDQTFTPFHPVMDVQPAVHFGFDHALPAGLASLFLDIPESVAQDSGPSPFLWEYLSVNGWSELGVLDETQGFQSSGMLQLVGQPDAISAPGLGGNLYWVRARLKQGELPTAATVSGVWLNAVWASQRTSTATELAGAQRRQSGASLRLAAHAGAGRRTGGSPGMDGQRGRLAIGASGRPAIRPSITNRFRHRLGHRGVGTMDRSTKPLQFRPAGPPLHHRARHGVYSLWPSGNDSARRQLHLRDVRQRRRGGRKRSRRSHLGIAHLRALCAERGQPHRRFRRRGYGEQRRRGRARPASDSKPRPRGLHIGFRMAGETSLAGCRAGAVHSDYRARRPCATGLGHAGCSAAHTRRAAAAHAGVSVARAELPRGARAGGRDAPDPHRRTVLRSRGDLGRGGRQRCESIGATGGGPAQ
jgi:hypothetical protein